MLSVSHAAIGGFIAHKTGNPYLYIPLTLASHYLADFVPHWDVGQGLTKGKKDPKAAFLQELFIDFPGSILVVYLLFQMGQPFNPALWIAWFVSLLPDFMEAPRSFLKWEPFFLRPFNQFHHWLHHSTPNKLLGLSTQVLVFILIPLFR